MTPETQNYDAESEALYRPPVATTYDAEEADTHEPDPGLWNLWGRLPVTRQSESLSKAVAALILLLVLIGCSALTRYRSLHASGQGTVSAQGGTLLLGLLWSLLIVPVAALVIWLASRYVLLLIREHWQED